MGTLDDIETVDNISRKLAEEINLFVIEVPGMGQTEPLPSYFTIQDQAAFLLAIIDKLDIFSAHLFCISYSTPIAVELCSIWSGALSLAMCGGMLGVDENWRLPTMALLSSAINDRKAFATTFIDGLMVNDPNIPRTKVIARSAKRKILNNPDKQIRCFCENTLRLLTYKPSPSISKIYKPAILIIGDKDPYVTLRKARELANTLPNCDLKIVNNADHLVHIEQMEQVTELMLSLSTERSWVNQPQPQYIPMRYQWG